MSLDVCKKTTRDLYRFIDYLGAVYKWYNQLTDCRLYIFGRFIPGNTDLIESKV